MPIYKDHSFRSGASAAAGADSVYEINQSIRFNDGDSPYMTRTPSSGGNRKKWTFSVWFKLGDLETTQRMFFSVRNSDTTRDNIMFNQGSAGDYRIYFDARVSGSAHTVLEPTRALRDPSAWYHLVVTADTTNAVSSERVKMYLNGERETVFTNETYPGVNQDFQINHTVAHTIGRFEFSSPSGYWDGYMTEIIFLDGYAYGPEYFGTTNSSGIWIPIDYDTTTGNYGTNGFKIDGSDSATLGKNVATGNTYASYTSSGLAAHDQVLDTPNNNFCVLNSADKYSYDSGQTVRGVRDQGLAFISKPAGNQNGFGAGNMAVKSGKWYYEMYTTTYPSTEALGFGYADVQDCATATASPTRDFGLSNRHTGSAYSSWFWGTSSSTSTGLTPYGQGVVMGVYTDFDNNELKVYKDGVLYGSVDFDSTSPTDNLTSEGIDWVPRFTLANDQTAKIHVNFGQDDSFNGNKTSGSAAASDDNGFGRFYYTPLSGYLALCTSNLFTG